MAAVQDFGNGRGAGFDRVPRPFVIGVAGGTASGKSTVCEKIMQQLGQTDVDRRQRQVAIISQDSFYKALTDKQKEQAAKGQFNFDHPDENQREQAVDPELNFDHPEAFDAPLMLETMRKVVAGKTVDVSAYDYVKNSRNSSNLAVYPADVVLFEGILVFYWPELCNMFHMKLFVDTDPDTRLCRRVLRDTKERGRELDQILNQYTNLVKPAFEEFCLPTKKYADVIIPRGADNTVAIDLIVQHIQELLRPTPTPREARRRHNSDSFAGRPH